MSELASRAIAVVGVGAILPDALSAPAFWQNIRNKRYCISETPPERWSVADYYDPDPNAPDKTYSKIGGWVRGFEFDWKKYRIPPKVAAAMDDGQKWAVTIAAEALADYGYPERPLDTERTAVILGTAMGGELHYITTMRIQFPEYRRALENASGFNQLPADVRAAILAQWHERMDAMLPPITEDTMPGELPNIVSGRVANVLNLRGASFITDAACASSFAALNAAVEMLASGQADAVVTGGVDRNMGANIFVKFCKIGALSATGSRPFGDGADGFVMGEGSAAFLLKRLTDAERDGDKIYAVIRGVGGSSDGKGKGITAPNPIGQILAAERAWANAGLDPATATLVEAHGTSTKVGDVVELESLGKVFGNARQGSIALGSAKGNIGHLKAGAGAAGLLKAVMAVHDKVLPPTLNAEKPNPNADMAHSPFFLNHELQPWPRPANYPRRAGVSSYGFGGTNFHVVLEEYVPGVLHTEERVSTPVNKVASTPAGKEMSTQGKSSDPVYPSASTAKAPIRGILAIGAATPVALKDKLDEMWRKVEDGWTPPVAAPAPADIAAPERLVIDFGDHNDLHDKLAKARKAAGFDNPQAWKALAAQGIFRGSGKPAGKIAFLFPGQGSQYTNMGRALAEREPVVAETFKEADAVMTPILGRSLTSYIFVDSNDPAAMKQAERDLMQTAITQPAMLTADTAFYKLLAEYGFRPDMVMGHSLGEYGALIAADIMPFAHALEASAARGAEMTKVSMDDNGWMAAVMAPYEVIEQTLTEIDGYVVAANINSKSQAVVGGASKAVEQAIERFTQKGFQAMRIPVSHAFHTRIVAPASKPLRKVLDRLSISAPALPLVANVTGELYPTTVEGIKDILELQIASPVQWVKGLETMYREGCRVFVEVGPKKALKGFVDDVLGSKPDVVSLFTNHPKTGELASFNQTLCGLYAAGFGVSSEQPAAASVQSPVAVSQPVSLPAYQSTNSPVSQPVPAPVKEPVMSQPTVSSDALGQLAQVLQQLAGAQPAARAQAPYDRNEPPLGSVVISGTGLGLPGPNKPLMDPDNALRILRGEQFIDLIPERFRQRMLDKRITRLVKSEDGGGSFQVIADPTEVLRLAGRAGSFDLTEEYGVPAKLVEALDITTQYCFAAGLDALREAGIPLVQTWRKTTTGKYLPDRWMLPEALRDETGVIFASAFPGGDRFSEEFARYYAWENRRMQLAMLEDLRGYTNDMQTMQEINRRITELREQMAAEPYEFDRRFVFRILAMGHSQFAEYIGARGPNTHVNAACASTAQGVALAEDWIRSGRCRRVLVLGGDDVTSDNLMEWVGSGFLALGASATDDRVEEAALPFDRRRHGTILGMGACALAVESEDAVRERGMRGIVELLSSETANSAYHGSRLDVNHISQIMESLVASAERRFGLNRYAMAGQTVFISHETYTPARGGSASAEVIALRNTFGAAASDVVVANTKGFTGHPMGVGVEDVIAVKILEYGIVPPVPNFKEVDPDLGVLNLSRGGRYPVQFALHLAAGFGSQISLTLTRRIPGGLDRTDDKLRYQYWLDSVSGYDRAELEVVKRNLRVKSQDGPGRTPAPSVWRFGYGPAQRAAAPGDGRGTVAYTPQPMPAVRELLGKPAVSEPTVERAAPVPMPAAAPAPVAAPAPAAPKPAPAASPAPKPAPAPAAPPAPAPVAAAVPAPVAPVVDPVVGRVLGIVAEKTGYPQDMLDLDLDLEADLGIDTVKQAETFQAVREAFGIPQQEGISLRDYPTLERVIGFVRTMRPDLAAGVAVGAPSSTGASGLTTFAASGASSAMSGAPTVTAA
ncbi:MAG: beta-ketoacyl synthase N-terminal-like domain-containing protein, partial [Caldilineales bacterium]